MPFDEARIQRAIVGALESYDFAPEVSQDVAFHMTDWLSDMEQWDAFCQNPDSLSPDDVHTLLIRFLIHAPNHIAAAHKLFLGYPLEDIFEVGIFREEE